MFVSVLVILAIIFLAVISPEYRALLLLVACGWSVLIGVAWSNQEQEYLRHRITLNDLKFSDTSIKPWTNVQNPTYWVLEGIVANNSTHRLESLEFMLRVRDCNNADSNEGCRIVSEERTHAYDLNVPPGQTRAFKTISVRFKNLPDKKIANVRQFNWNVGEIRAAN